MTKILFIWYNFKTLKGEVMFKKIVVIVIVFYLSNCTKGISKKTMDELEEARRALEAAKTALSECKSERENLNKSKSEKEELLKKLNQEKDSLSNLLELIKKGY